jgi:hypothetical protein
VSIPQPCKAKVGVKDESGTSHLYAVMRLVTEWYELSHRLRRLGGPSCPFGSRSSSGVIASSHRTYYLLESERDMRLNLPQVRLINNYDYGRRKSIWPKLRWDAVPINVRGDAVTCWTASDRRFPNRERVTERPGAFPPEIGRVFPFSTNATKNTLRANQGIRLEKSCRKLKLSVK